MMDKVDWDADAAVVLRVETEIVGSERGGIVWNGPLADAVLFFLELPANERDKAEIVISYDGGTRNSWLGPADVEALALRPDYPYRG